MKTLTGYALSRRLREVAEDTANPERAELMIAAADEIEQLCSEIREASKAQHFTSQPHDPR